MDEGFILLHGLLFAGMVQANFDSLGEEARMRRFLAMYCLPPIVWLTVFDNLQNLLPNDHPDYIHPRNLTLKKLLVFAHWVATDRVFANLATQFGMSERTVQTWTWKYARVIAALREFKIIWGNFGPDDVKFIASVDGVHFPIKEPRSTPSAKWFSHKTHGPALAYEIALSLYVNQIAWSRGPYPAATADITIFRDGLEGMIPDGQLVIGDSGYSASDRTAVIEEDDSPDVLEFKNRARARQENINERLKRFDIIGTRFRYGIENHEVVTNACLNLVQYDVETGRPLISVL